MPNRILREGILHSERIDSLDSGAEVFYRRLMSVVDDFGRFHGNWTLIRAACYPLRIDKVTNRDVSKWINQCASAGLVETYKCVDGKEFLQLLDFRQRVRSAGSKFPDPSDSCRSHDGHVTVTRPSCARLDVDVDVDVDVGKTKRKRFVPPSLEEVMNYCGERKNNVHAERFIDFYESKGWMVGKNKMKDWKAAVRNWERSEKPKQPDDDFGEF